MDTGPSTHPTPEILRAYGLGELDDASASVVSKHLGCPDCRRQVSEVAPDDLIDRLRRHQAQSETSNSDQDLESPGASEPTADVGTPLSSPWSPCMSSTGQVDATSDALDRRRRS